MLRLAASNPLPNLCLVLDHDDRERDMYDRKPLLLKIAESEKWPVIKVSTDFRVVFPDKTLQPESVQPVEALAP